MNQLHRPGFTLIELLIVIAIIGLLTSIGGVAWNNARQKSRDGLRKANVNQIKKALELSAQSNSGLYPVETAFACHSTSIPSGLGPFISPIPTDPIPSRTTVLGSTGGCMNYQSDGIDYKIRTQLELDTTQMTNDGGALSTWYEVFTPGAQSWKSAGE